MPFGVVHKNNGYYVENKNTHHKFSNHPLSKETANAQLRAIYANYGRSGGNLEGGDMDDFKIDELNKKPDYEPGIVLKLGKNLTKFSKDLVKGTVNTVETMLHDLTNMKDDDSSDEEDEKAEKSMRKIKKEERKIERFVEKELQIQAEIFLPVMEELSEKLFKKMGWMILARHMDKDEKVNNYKKDIKHLMKALMKLSEKTKQNFVDHERVKKLYKNLKVLHDYVEKHF